MDLVIATAYASSTQAVQGALTTYWIPLMIFLLGVAVLFFVGRKVFNVFGGRRRAR